MEKKYCVYVHTNKVNGKRYVGITSQKPEKRWKNGYRDNQHFSRAIKKYGWNGFSHEIFIDGLTKEQACLWESALIAQYETQDQNKGYNIQSGGEGCAEQNKVAVNQYTLDGKFIKTWSCMKDASEFFGVFHNGGSQIGMACNGKCKSAHGYMWKYADGVTDIKPYKNGHLKQVVQCDMNGNPIKTWERIADASRALGIDAGAITKVCKDKYRSFKSAGGYIWRYSNAV